MPGDSLPLLFGIEEEHFICSCRGVPTLVQLLNLWAELESRGWTRVTDASQVVIAARRYFEGLGDVEVKTDFCTHLLEVAYSPLASLANLASFRGLVWRDLSFALLGIGLFPVPRSTLDTVPEGTLLHGSLDNLARYQAHLSRVVPARKYAHSHSVAAMASLQVSVALTPGQFVDFRKLYPFLIGAAELYCQPGSFNGASARRIRPLMWRDTFRTHRALGYPEVLPDSSDSYETWLAAGREVNRDYSFIALRSPSRLEFRLGDAQTSNEGIGRMVSYYAAMLAVHQSSDFPSSWGRELFYSVCEGTLPPGLGEMANELVRARELLPEELHHPLLASVHALTHQTEVECAQQPRVQRCTNAIDYGEALVCRYAAVAETGIEPPYTISPFGVQLDREDGPEVVIFIARQAGLGVTATLRFTPELDGDSIAYDQYQWSELMVALGIGNGLACGLVSRIDRLAVLPQFRRLGIMRELLMAVEEEAVSLGKTALIAAVEVHNQVSLSAFCRLGFKPYGQPATSRGQSFVTLQKDLRIRTDLAV